MKGSLTPDNKANGIHKPRNHVGTIEAGGRTTRISGEKVLSSLAQDAHISTNADIGRNGGANSSGRALQLGRKGLS